MKEIYQILGALVFWVFIFFVVAFLGALALGLVRILHEAMIKKRWYRIGYSTITYPILRWKIKRAWRLKSKKQVIQAWNEYLKKSDGLVDTDSWYQKRLEKYVLKKFVEPALI